MQTKPLNILIFGSGAVGLGLGSCLLKAGVDMTFIDNADTVAAFKQKGILRSGIFGEFAAPPESFSAYTDLAQIQSKTFDFILVCTKSNHVATAAEAIGANRHLLKKTGKIVHFQNGWGNAEKILPFFNENIVYSGRVITGFTKPEPHHVVVTVHADAVHVGSLFGKSLEPVEPLCRAIDAGGIPCQPWKDIAKDLWAKLLYNCALNPLGAILDVPYGKLADNPHTRALMNRIIEEVYAVMQAADFSTYRPTADEYKDVFYTKLVPPTAEHKSSTLQDLQSGRKTEIEALTGQVLQLAKKTGIDVPCNSMLYTLIRFIEERNA